MVRDPRRARAAVLGLVAALGVVAVAVAAAIGSALPSPALPRAEASGGGDDERLEGEFELKIDHRLVDARAGDRWITRARVPTITEIARKAKLPGIEPVVILGVHEDESNHYVPAFRADGRALTFLTADIERRTAKVAAIADLSRADSPALLFPDTPGSYDYMFGWAPSVPPGDATASPAFVLASQRRSGVMDIYAAAGLDDEPKLLARGEADAIAKQPAIAPAPPGAPVRVAYEAGGTLFLVTAPRLRGEGGVLEGAGDPEKPERLGPGAEPEWSPDGRFLVHVRASSAGANARLAVVTREVTTGRERVLYEAAERERVRGPRFTPDGARVLFHAATRDEQDDGRGYAIVAIDVDPANTEALGEPRRLLENVAAQPHFDSHPIAVSSDGRLVLAFGVDADEDGYYKIRWAALDGSGSGAIDHSDEFTTSTDVAVDPDGEACAIAFAAVESVAQGIYVVILNHWGEEDE